MLDQVDRIGVCRTVDRFAIEAIEERVYMTVVLDIAAVAEKDDNTAAVVLAGREARKDKRTKNIVDLDCSTMPAIVEGKATNNLTLSRSSHFDV